MVQIGIITLLFSFSVFAGPVITDSGDDLKSRHLDSILKQLQKYENVLEGMRFPEHYMVSASKVARNAMFLFNSNTLRVSYTYDFGTRDQECVVKRVHGRGVSLHEFGHLVYKYNVGEFITDAELKDRFESYLSFSTDRSMQGLELHRQRYLLEQKMKRDERAHRGPKAQFYLDNIERMQKISDLNSNAEEILREVEANHQQMNDDYIEEFSELSEFFADALALVVSNNARIMSRAMKCDFDPRVRLHRKYRDFRNMHFVYADLDADTHLTYSRARSAFYRRVFSRFRFRELSKTQMLTKLLEAVGKTLSQTFGKTNQLSVLDKNEILEKEIDIVFELEDEPLPSWRR